MIVGRQLLFDSRYLFRQSSLTQVRAMTSSSSKPIYFGPFEVANEVFYNTPLCYALVNIKPLLPGHVLIIPYRKAQRLTDLTPEETTDIFSTVQKVQRMLASVYFPSQSEPNSSSPAKEHLPQRSITEGSFNVALQDGVDAGQTVPHVHVHIIPRTKESSQEGDGIYARLQGEEGNVGGGLWDLQQRPVSGGRFPVVKDEDRRLRGKEEMGAEAKFFREKMEALDAR